MTRPDPRDGDGAAETVPFTLPDRPAAAPAEPQAATGPAATGPTVAEPAATGPATAGPATAGPAATEPATAEPAATGPATAEPAAAGTTAAEPAARAGNGPGSRRRGLDARGKFLIRLVAAGLCALLGVSLAAQFKSTERDSQLPTARQEDLVRIVDDLENREQRVRDEISDLESRRRELNSRAKGSEAALSDLKERATELGILTGTQPYSGAGVRLRFTAGRSRLPAELLLNTVEELRGSGAEAMQITGAEGPPVRIVASTYFVDTGTGVDVDGTQLEAPYVVVAVGSASTMAGAMRIPGGVTDETERRGGTVQVDTETSVSVTATRRVSAPRYAKPVS